MERHFDDELLALKQKLLQMADTAQEMVGLAVSCIAERSGAPAVRVERLEKDVNRMEVEIEEEVVRLIALRQPIAKDLRLLTAVLKINTDLERVADQACNISETAAYLAQEPPLAQLAEIAGMARVVQRMVRDGIEAFVKHDPALARAVCGRDDEVDRANERIFSEMLAFLGATPGGATRAVDLILVSRNLERVADHATNICEEVIFIERGENIKHHVKEADACS